MSLLQVDFHVYDWVNLFLRWSHLILGIGWIGSSFYFMWLDSHLILPESPSPTVEGELWMVHSGGFYLVERKRIGPGTMPKVLHWFKYEALFTWISGISLLAVVYYLNGAAFLIDPTVSRLSAGRAIGLSVALLTAAWFVYDFIWQSKLGQRFSRAATALCLALACGAAYVLCHELSGRAAFIHFGAMLGTLMVANVWVRILPAQQKMVDATKEGRQPDFTLSAKAKRRSVHNSYMTFPVLFMMLSNHYSNTYGAQRNWIILILLVALGVAVRHVMLGKNGSGRWAITPAALALGALITLTSSPAPGAGEPTFTGAHVSFAEANAVIQSRCLACHSNSPRITAFGPSPSGVNFEAPERIHAFAGRIKLRAAVNKTMPLANLTQITDGERELLGRWVDQGAEVAQ